jgi:hypothetical protein
MKTAIMPLGVVLLASSLPALLPAAELQAITLGAWNEYVQNADSRMRARLDGQKPFLWSDETLDRKARLQRGEVLVAPIATHGTEAVPDGLIHDWIGAAFVPNVSLEAVLGVVHNYDRYKEVFKPAVADSKLLACSGEDQRFSMIWAQKVLFVNAAIEGQYVAHDFVLDERRLYGITRTTLVREIEAYGRSGEHRLPPGRGNGFIWQLHSITRYEQRDGGVYIELEAIALTRAIPESLRWLVMPVVHHLSVNSLTISLRQIREAVRTSPGRPGQLAGCAKGGDSGSAKAGSGDYQ